jgi:hypothetical protein
MFWALSTWAKVLAGKTEAKKQERTGCEFYFIRWVETYVHSTGPSRLILTFAFPCGWPVRLARAVGPCGWPVRLARAVGMGQQMSKSDH